MTVSSAPTAAPRGSALSMALRASVVLLFGLGFFALVAAVLLGCGGLAWAIVHSHHIPVKLLVVLVIVAGGLLWALIPRFERWVPPGPHLRREHEPRFFAWLDRLGELTGQKVPSEVYLLDDANAFVTARGGVFGIGSRRVMGVGLPFIQGMSQAELGAVIGHELGHFAGGDVLLGGLVYRLRRVILRVVAHMRESVLAVPFLAYAKAYLRASAGISRRQELAADRVSARVAGTDAACAALSGAAGTALMHHAYLETEVLPLARVGVGVPIASGWEIWARSDHASRLRLALEASASRHEAEPYDTHPPTPERIAALKARPEPGLLALGAAPASALFDDLEACARRVVAHVVPHALTPYRWEETGGAVVLPIYRSVAAMHAQAFAGLTLGDLGEQREALTARLEGTHDGADHVTRTIGATIAVALVDRLAWSLVNRPGDPVRARSASGSYEIDPLALAGELRAPDVSGWRERRRREGLADLAL
ncbi:MAG: M48 family metalloprotease [Myxococcales bacterium]|nr:M48 family metalloprotease [Myxococcales bacterium]MCB9734857.1 M48 family metalloprotease [Deltaproteobacteria bacterium]